MQFVRARVPGRHRRVLAAALVVILGLVGFSPSAPAAAGDPPAWCTFTRAGDGYRIEWAPVTGVDKYLVRRSVGPISSSSEPYWRAAPGPSATTYTSSGSLAADDVQYFLSTRTGGSESPRTPCRLLAPVGVSALATGSAAAPAVTVSWTADPDASIGYNVYLGTGGAPINGTPIAGPSYVVTSGLAPSTAPTFRVTALSLDPRGGGTVVESDAGPAVGAPGTPLLQSATPGPDDGTLTLTWSAVADAQQGYDVQRDGAHFASTASTGLTIDAPSAQGDLALGTHTWTVSARANGDLRSAPSAPATVTVADTRRPDPPGGLSIVEVGATTASLTWNAPDQTATGGPDPSGFAEYRLYHDTDPSGNRAGSGDVVLDAPTEPGATVVGLTPATDHRLYVTAIDGAGNESYISNRITVTTDEVPPPAPGRPTAVDNGDGSLTVSWDPVPGATGYNILRDGGHPVTSEPTTATSHVDGSFAVVPSFHTYEVEAVNGAGVSPRSPRSAAVEVTDASSCATTSGTGRWRTAEVCGVWQIVAPDGAVTHWEATNLKFDSVIGSGANGNNALDAADVAAIAGRFDAVRLTMRWDLVQPGGPTQVAHAAAITGLLDDFDAAGVPVILDIVHLSGGDGGTTAFAIPAWAWDTTGIADPAQRTRAASYPAWAGTDNRAGNVTAYIDALAGAGILTHSAVAAVEVVNEPHPLAADAITEAGQDRLAAVHRELVDHIRTHDPAMMVVVGAYFGGLRHGGPLQPDGSHAFNSSRDVLDRPNTVWTAHSYYTGVGDSADGTNDGLAPSGQRGVGTWAEGWNSAGCYGTVAQPGDLTVPWSCPSATPENRSTAQAGHRNNAAAHHAYAQEAGMPFLMGEWGMPRQRYQSGYRGWDHAEYQACDKLAAFADIDGQGTAISWAVWSWDANFDTFGVYFSRDTPEPDNPARSLLTPNSWVRGGTFGAESQGWAGRSWEFARPFADPGYCASLG